MNNLAGRIRRTANGTVQLELKIWHFKMGELKERETLSVYAKCNEMRLHARLRMSSDC